MSQHRPYKNTEVFYDSDISICNVFDNINNIFFAKNLSPTQTASLELSTLSF